MAEFSATFTVKAVPVISTVSPSEDPNIALQVPGSAVITLTPSPLTDPTNDTFSLTFAVATESEMTFQDPPWEPRLLDMPPGVEIQTSESLSSTEFSLEVQVTKTEITTQRTIPFYICTNIGCHDPSIVIDPPPPQ